MSDTNVNEALLHALQTQWNRTSPGANEWEVGGRTVTQFDTSKVHLRLLTIDYPDLNARVLSTPVLIQSSNVKNPSPAEVTQHFSYDRTFTDAYEWSVTAGVTLSASATFKTGLPIVGEGEATAGVELNFSGEYRNSHSEEVAFKGGTDVQVPPATNVVIKAVLTQGSVDAVPFKATLEAYGSVGAYTAFGSDTYLWQWADLGTGLGWTDPNFRSVAPLKDDSVRRFVVEGLFTSVCGFHVDVVVDPVSALTGEALEPEAAVAL